MHACHVMIMSRSGLPLQEISTFSKERRAVPPCFHFAWTSSGTSRRPLAFLRQTLIRVASKALWDIDLEFGDKASLIFRPCQHGCLLVNQHSICGVRVPSLFLRGRNRLNALGRRCVRLGCALANHVFIHVLVIAPVLCSECVYVCVCVCISVIRYVYIYGGTCTYTICANTVLYLDRWISCKDSYRRAQRCVHTQASGCNRMKKIIFVSTVLVCMCPDVS